VAEGVPPPPRRDDLAVLAASGAAFHVPLSEARAADLVAQIPLAPGRHVLDLGCGCGELLLRVVAAHPATTGTGVENVGAALRQADRGLVERALGERGEIGEDDPATVQDVGSLVIALQVTTVFGIGGWPEAIRHRLEPGGVALVGADVVTADAAVVAGLPTLASLAASAAEAGYRILRSDTATRDELDAYEVAVRAGLSHTTGDESSDDRRRAYESGPLGERGFAMLLLGVV
jgi:SAM-dependent methyltransferase